MAQDEPQTRPDDPTIRVDPSSGAETLATRVLGSPVAGVPRTLGPYQLLEELGQGGMGVVYRARHAQLGTECAVKVLIAGEHASPDSIARFRREASAVARMGKHPNIVTVFDLGEEGSLSYYAMELVEGKSLRRRLAERTYAPKESAALVEKVARALHFAHQHGVIHRDVKPENIVMRGDEPQVMDFGLAKDVGSTMHISVTGQVMGTPAYMAPEQVRGDVSATDARTDVYALGCVLYELLAGVPPHGGDDLAAIFASVTAGEVVPPRALRPGLPRDVETVCMKCLEVEPSRRYPTAEALAEDLARFQHGEEVVARPVGRLALLGRRVRRRPLVSALLACVVVAALVIPAMAWKRAQERKAATKEQERLRAEALDQLRVLGDALVDASLARRALGDIAGSRRYAEMLWPAVNTLKQEAPLLAEPYFHEGRMLRALQRNDEAERAQDEAVRLASLPDADAGSRAVRSRALYERGVLRFLKWTVLLSDRGLDWLRAQPAQGEESGYRAPTAAEVEAAYPDARDAGRLAEEDLGIVSEDVRAEARLRTAARALASSMREPREAPALLGSALKEDRYSVELHWALAMNLLSTEDDQRILECFMEAHRADRGYTPFAISLAEALTRAARPSRPDASDLRAQALQVVDETLSMDAGCRDAWIARSFVLIHQGKAFEKAAQGEKAREAYDAALAACDRVLALDPRNAGAFYHQAIVHLQWARAMREQGKDPSQEYQRAREELERALSFDPKLPPAYVALTGLWSELGGMKVSRGQDARPEFQKALAAIEQALSQQPGNERAIYVRGTLFTSLGMSKERGGEDPVPDLDRALHDYDLALSLDPKNSAALSHKALTWQSLGQWEKSQGRDPTAPFQRAIEAYDAALSLDPRNLQVILARAWVWSLLGDTKRDFGKDPSAEYEKALAGFVEARAAEPRNVVALQQEANVLRSLAEAKQARGEDASAGLAKAAEDFDALASLAPQDWQPCACRGLMLERLGRYSEAAQAYEKANALAKTKSTGMQGQLDRARTVADAEEAVRRGDLAAARTRYEAAIALAPSSDPDLRAIQREIHVRLAGVLSRGGAAQTDDAKETAHLRDLAFEHLRRAVGLGCADAKRLANDASLATLHGDPRWEELLRRIAK